MSTDDIDCILSATNANANANAAAVTAMTQVGVDPTPDGVARFD